MPFPILPCGAAYSLPLNTKHEAKYMKKIIALLLALIVFDLSVRGEDTPPALLEAIGVHETGMKPFTDSFLPIS